MTQVEVKPISSFYCCYLLRSKVKHTKLYVGSTPNPKRRLDQHNGIAKGGAKRTGICGGMWRPWEMSLIVTGFPTNIAALQFEWAWQNSHLTRKISKEQRISVQETIAKYSKKRGKIINRPAKLPISLKDKLANLHLLLRVPSFARWPLQLRFFRQDVFDSWQKWLPEFAVPLREGITTVQDFETGTEAADQAEFKQSRINALDVTYAPIKDRVEKSLLLKSASGRQCACCEAQIDMSVENLLVCSKQTCYSVNHLACLAKAFLGPDSEEVVPVEGECPKCKTSLRWTDLVQEMTLRTRDEKEVTRLMKPKRRKAVVESSQAQEVDQENEVAEEEDDAFVKSVIDEPSIHEVERWECESLASIATESSVTEQKKPEEIQSGSRKTFDRSTVIEDSEDSDTWRILD